MDVKNIRILIIVDSLEILLNRFYKSMIPSILWNLQKNAYLVWEKSINTIKYQEFENSITESKLLNLVNCLQYIADAVKLYGTSIILLN